MFNLTKIQPIIVDVTEDRWDAYSQNPTPSRTDLVLLKAIHAQGGVSDRVPPGRYYVGFERVGFHITWSFTPVEK